MTKNVVSRDAPRAEWRSLFRAAAGVILALGLVAPTLSGTAEASTVGFKVDGAWSNVSGGDRVGGKGTNHLSWGGLSKSRRSAYVFDGLNPNANVPVPTAAPIQVDLGRFTHKNLRIPHKSGIKGATLGVNIDVMVENGASKSITPLSFSLKHWETDNRASPCANGEANRQGINAKGCADRIQFASNVLPTETFSSNGTLYTFKVLGFFNTKTNEKLGLFWTKEKNDNVAVLRGEISAVPVPAAGLLLLGGLGGIGALAARRRRR